MKITLQRHGLTAGNLRRAYVGGATDEPLCAQGLSALRAQPARSDVKRVYTSHLRRTRQSAAIYYPQAAQIVVPELREMEFGRFEGLNWHDLAGDAAYRAWVEGGCLAACPGGESRAQFVARCLVAFTEIVQREQGEEQLHFLIHGGTIRAILSELALPRGNFFDYDTRPGSCWLCELKDDPGHVSLALRILESPVELSPCKP